MMDNTAYRLDNYRITCCENTLYWWESHLAMGMQRRGRCFVHKNLLVIGYDGRDEHGYLIGEFLEELQKLPEWDKTLFYCLAHELFHVTTGECPSDEILAGELAAPDKNTLKQSPDPAPGTFRLSRYRLTITAASEISWQGYGEGGHLIAGPCFLESDLLCVDSQRTEEKGQGKQEFLASLDSLPQWEQTLFWCHAAALRPCRQLHQAEKQSATFRQSGVREDGAAPRPAAAPQSSEIRDDGASPEQADPFPRTGHKEWAQQCAQAWRLRLQAIISRISPKKIWSTYWLPLVAAGLLLGVTFLIHAFEEGFDWRHWFTKDHHEHHDHDHHKEHE